MKYLILAIVPIMVGILTPLVFGLIRKANLKKEAKMNKRDFVMCYPLAWAWFLLFLSVALATILILLNIFDEVRVVVNVIIAPFIVLFIFGVYLVVREKFVIKNDMIIITSAFGKTKTYTFSEIKKLKEVTWSNGTISYKVYSNTKLFSLSNSVPGYNLFMDRVKEAKIKIETVDEQKHKRNGG